MSPIKSDSYIKNRSAELLSLVLLFIIGCHGKNKSKEQFAPAVVQNEPQATRAMESQARLTFFDSIINKSELTLRQVREHLIIDSLFYTGFYKEATFVGDTIVRLRNGFTGAIIEYDDHKNCIFKFLFVFSPRDNLNTGHELIYSDCDRDGDSYYTTTRYKLLNDSVFEISENYFPEHSEEPAISKTRWLVNQKGGIDSIPGRINKFIK
jgi:hypothetical protein